MWPSQITQTLPFGAFEVDATAEVVTAAEVNVGTADAGTEVVGVTAADVAVEVVGVTVADEVVGVEFVSLPLGFLNKLAQLS